MKSRAEVLQEFGAAWNTSGEQAMADHIAAVEHQRDEYHRLWKAAVLEKRELSDRIRELEAQRDHDFAIACSAREFMRVATSPHFSALSVLTSQAFAYLRANIEEADGARGVPEANFGNIQPEAASGAPVAWAPVSDPYQFAAPFAWMLVKNGKPQGIPVSHRPSDWPEVERAWGATFVPLYPQRKSVELLERQWLEACEMAQDYCKRHGITEYGRSVFALLVEDAERLRADAPPSAAGVSDAEVEAGAKRMYEGPESCLGIWRYATRPTKEHYRALAKGCLTAAREVQP